MKKVLVQTVQPDVGGPVFGQASDPLDLMKSQNYAHDHANALARDFFIHGADGPLAVGFAATPLGGMRLSVAAGQVLDLSGRSFEMHDVDEVEIQLLPAHPTLGRIDLICALIEVDAPAEEEFRSFVRLRTQDELEDVPPVSPYPPTQLSVATEQHTRATVTVKSGTPAENPAVPPVAVNEVVLYQISVGGGLAIIREEAIVPINKGLPSTYELWTQLRALADLFNFSQLNPRHYTASEISIGPGAEEYEGKSVQEFINDEVHRRDLNSLSFPEILTPELARNHPDAGKLGAVGEVDTGMPVIDLPVNREIVFRSGTQVLTPGKFPAEVNARIVSKAAGAGTETLSNQVNFSMGSVVEIASDGEGRMIQAIPTLPIPRKRPAVCGRGDRFIEIISGFAASEAALTDWYTYDVLANTLTLRAFSVPPAAPSQYATAFSCGVNSNDVLLVMGQEGAANWYRLNAVTGVLTTLAGGPAGWRFVGDLIAPDLVFFMSNEGHAGVHRYWKFIPSTNTFQELTPTGTQPTVAPEHWLVGFYEQGKAILLEGILSGTINTYVYDSATNQFVKLSIPGPYSDRPELGSGDTFSLQGGALLPAQGRTIFVGAIISKGLPVHYEIRPGASNPEWRALPTTGAVFRWYQGGGTVRPTSIISAYAVTAGGILPGGSPAPEVYKIEAGGLIETQFGGLPALTLSGNATFSIFRVADLLVGFQSGDVIASLVGSFPAGSIKIEYSIDDGVSWTHVTPGVVSALDGISTSRKLRITLFKSGTAAPVLQTLNEILHEEGGASFGINDLVLRFDVPAGFLPPGPVPESGWLYIDEHGDVTHGGLVVAEGTPSTPGRAVLLRFTPNELLAPEVKNYINRRYAHLLRRGTRDAGVTPVIEWNFAVMPQFLEATKVLADGTLKDLASATAFPEPLVFDLDIMVNGIAADGDGYRVDIEI